MACFWQNHSNSKIEILSSEVVANVTYYKIEVRVGDRYWTVNRRYNEFYDLHNHLVSENGISKDILPSKKVIRNRSPTFVESRRKGLEEYLGKIFVFLMRTMPKAFTDFLHFDTYDIFFILRELSSKLFIEADMLLAARKPYNFLTLEVHAISEYLKKPFPAIEITESRIDMSPVLDFCSHLELLGIMGSMSCYQESNIVLNELSFELGMFKNTKVVHMRNVDPSQILSLGNLRDTVVSLHLNETGIRSICEIIQCDVIHKHDLENSQKWELLEKLDLSRNNITEIDVSIILVPNLKELNLSDNKITTIPDLSKLSKLSHLNLPKNSISSCKDLHQKIGNVTSLNLSQNRISTCSGFERLYSLESFDLSFNALDDILEVGFLGDLPCLEDLVLTGNNLATCVDYRTKVFEYFGERANIISLDNEKASQSELDKVSVLRALRIVKEGRTPNLRNGFN